MSRLSGNAVTLGENISATPSTGSIWPGGEGIFTAEATWGGGTVKLQFQTRNGTWVDVGDDTTMTENGAAGFILPRGMIRANVATATAVYAYAEQL